MLCSFFVPMFELFEHIFHFPELNLAITIHQVIRQPAFALLCMYRFFDGAVNTLLLCLHLEHFSSAISSMHRAGNRTAVRQGW